MNWYKLIEVDGDRCLNVVSLGTCENKIITIPIGIRYESPVF